MTIAAELDRIISAKNDILSAINDKGVSTAGTTSISQCPALINAIQTGGGGGSYMFTTGLTASASGSSEVYLELEQIKATSYTASDVSGASATASAANVGRPYSFGLTWGDMSAYSYFTFVGTARMAGNYWSSLTDSATEHFKDLFLLFYTDSANPSNGLSASAVQKLDALALEGTVSARISAIDTAQLVTADTFGNRLTWYPQAPDSTSTVYFSLKGPTAATGAVITNLRPYNSTASVLRLCKIDESATSYPYSSAPSAITGTARCVISGQDNLVITENSSSLLRYPTWKLTSYFDRSSPTVSSYSSTTGKALASSNNLLSSVNWMVGQNMFTYRAVYTSGSTTAARAPQSAYAVTYSSLLGSASGESGFWS